MRVGIDLSVAGTNPAGTGIYGRSLVKAIKRVSDSEEIVAFSAPRNYPSGERRSPRSRLNTLYVDLIWRNVILPRRALDQHIDALHMPAFFIPLLKSVPIVVTMFDMTPLLHPSDFTLWRRLHSRLFIPHAARNADAIITISENSREDIIRLLHVPAHKITITALGASPSMRRLAEGEVQACKAKLGLGQFILSVGTLEPRKNLRTLLRSLVHLSRDWPGLHIVHAGPRGWKYASTLRDINRLNLGRKVHLLGQVPLDELVRLYNAATVFVYPSLYEGFGLPVLEAMACGCPVVASNTSAIPEVAGDAALLIDPMDPQAIADAIQNVLVNEELSKELRQRGLRRAKFFSWEDCARKTLQVYRETIG